MKPACAGADAAPVCERNRMIIYNLIVTTLIFALVLWLGDWFGLPLLPLAAGSGLALLVCWIVDPTTRRLFQR